MTPTTQRTEGWPGGECVRAAYAALLDLPLEAVPPFDPASLGGRDQRTAEREWLATQGFGLEEICTAPDELPPAVRESAPLALHLISGLSPRGFGHRCVGFGGRVLFDPHPSRAGLTKVWSIGILLPRGHRWNGSRN